MLENKEKFEHMKYQERGNCRSTNKKDEAKRVKQICWHINNDTDIGKRLKRQYTNKFGRKMKSVYQQGGNNDHSDIVVIEEADDINPETNRKIEEKYSKNPIGQGKKPWARSVQRYNGPITKVSMGKQYSKHWYDNVVCLSLIHISEPTRPY